MRRMIDFLFSQPPAVKLLLLIAQAVMAVGVAWLVMRALGAVDRRKPGAVPIGPYFGSVTTLFALFLAFHASTIWSAQRDAEHSFREAVTAIARLEKLLAPGQFDAPVAIDALRRYVDGVIGEEWASGNARASPAAVKALDELRRELHAIAARIPATSGASLLRELDDLERSRAERLWVGAHHRHHDAWGVVFFLGFLAHIAIAVVHAERPRAGLVAILLFAVAVTVSYWLIIQAENPFAALHQVDPAVLRAQLRGSG